MTPILLTGAGGMIASLVLTLFWRHAVRQAKDAETARLLAESDAHAADADRKKTEEIVHGLHSEIIRLEADLAACSDPRLVRARLRALLAPTPAGVPDPDPAPGA